MAEFYIRVVMPDADLDNAVNFLRGSVGTLEQVKKDYFGQSIDIDFSKISEDQKRHYLANGLCAALINLQNEMYVANNVPAGE